MCGIAGFVGPASADLVTLGFRLARSLVHRGPDGEGVEVLTPSSQPDRRVVLVQRRLAIIDLSPGGRQPMVDPETGNWVVQNGEIYNYRELRRELAARGMVFRSESDTEVIVKGYSAYGVGILERLEGMFAIALWDASRDELLLAVDPTGIKPLYYWRGPDGCLVFGSEVRAMVATGLIPRRLDPMAIEGYLAYGAVQAPNTIVEGITALLGGTYARFLAAGTLDGPRRYWSPSFAPASAARVDTPSIVRDLKDLLGLTVRRHLVSDVPVGVFLSGGIDSSSIVALMSEVAPDVVNSFSVTFAEQQYSEAPYSRLIAERYSHKHHEITLTDRDLLEALPAALAAIDQPTINGVNVYVISRAAREAGMKVILSGQGGDEVFGGYPTFKLVPRAVEWRRRLRFVPNSGWALAAALWGVRHRRRAIPDKLSQFLAGDGSALSTFLLLRQLFPPSTRQELFAARPSEETDRGLPLALSDELTLGLSALDPINQVSLLETRTYLANMLLRDGDFMSMAHGLEVRVPMLDRSLVDFMAAIPGRYKVDRVLPKPLLIRAMGDLLPSVIYERPKQGFTFPWEMWLRGALRSRVATCLESGELERAAGLEPAVCRRLWNAFLEGRPGLTWARIWALFVLLDWCHRHQMRVN